MPDNQNLILTIFDLCDENTAISFDYLAQTQEFTVFLMFFNTNQP